MVLPLPKQVTSFWPLLLFSFPPDKKRKRDEAEEKKGERAMKKARAEVDAAEAELAREAQAEVVRPFVECLLSFDEVVDYRLEQGRRLPSKAEMTRLAELEPALVLRSTQSKEEMWDTVLRFFLNIEEWPEPDNPTI
jgi:hypothetical protein